MKNKLLFVLIYTAINNSFCSTTSNSNDSITDKNSFVIQKDITDYNSSEDNISEKNKTYNNSNKRLVTALDTSIDIVNTIKNNIATNIKDIKEKLGNLIDYYEIFKKCNTDIKLIEEVYKKLSDENKHYSEEIKKHYNNQIKLKLTREYNRMLHERAQDGYNQMLNIHKEYLKQRNDVNKEMDKKLQFHDTYLKDKSANIKEMNESNTGTTIDEFEQFMQTEIKDLFINKEKLLKEYITNNVRNAILDYANKGVNIYQQIDRVYKVFKDQMVSYAIQQHEQFIANKETMMSDLETIINWEKYADYQPKREDFNSYVEAYVICAKKLDELQQDDHDVRDSIMIACYQDAIQCILYDNIKDFFRNKLDSITNQQYKQYDILKNNIGTLLETEEKEHQKQQDAIYVKYKTEQDQYEKIIAERQANLEKAYREQYNKSGSNIPSPDVIYSIINLIFKNELKTSYSRNEHSSVIKIKTLLNDLLMNIKSFDREKSLEEKSLHAFQIKKVTKFVSIIKELNDKQIKNISMLYYVLQQIISCNTNGIDNSNNVVQDDIHLDKLLLYRQKNDKLSRIYFIDTSSNAFYNDYILYCIWNYIENPQTITVFLDTKLDKCIAAYVANQSNLLINNLGSMSGDCYKLQQQFINNKYLETFDILMSIVNVLHDVYTNSTDKNTSCYTF